MRKLTEFKFYKNTRFTDFQNTLLFESNAERDNYFNNEIVYTKKVVNGFNFIRDRGVVSISEPFAWWAGVNYCQFRSEFEDRTFYAFVMNYRYVNDNVTEVTLLIDGIMTFCQGETLNNIKRLNVTRQHLELENYKESLKMLRNNEDVIKTDSKYYFYENSLFFEDLSIIIESTADLSADFGTEKNPHLKTSYGMTYDKIQSPVDLYTISQDRFTLLMRDLSDYPWIAQNIKSMVLVPSILIDDTDLEDVDGKTLPNHGLKKFKSGEMNNNAEFQKLVNKKLNINRENLLKLFNLDSDEVHLLRSGYFTVELYGYNTKQLLIDLGHVNLKTGLKFKVESLSGYGNEFALVLEDYGTREYEDITAGFAHAGITGKEFRGRYLNDSLIFDTFDSVPLLLDNYRLGVAKHANQRQLAEDRQITGRLKRIVSPDTSLEEKFYDVASIGSNISPADLFGKFNDEHEFYRNQQAELADLQLETPTLTQQSTNNFFNIKNGHFGITMKCSRPNKRETEKLKNYYQLFGFYVNEQVNQLDDIRSQTVCNYLQFSGEYQIPNCPIYINEMIRKRFENGVRLWHVKTMVLEQKNTFREGVTDNTWNG